MVLSQVPCGNRLRELVGNLVETFKVVDVVAGVGIGVLDEVDVHASDQAEGFTGEQVVLRELVDFDDSCAEFVELNAVDLTIPGLICPVSLGCLLGRSPKR